MNTLNNEFYCSRCGKYKPTEARCSTLLCCSNCKEKVLAADASDETEKVEKKKVLSHALRLKIKLDDRIDQQKLKDVIYDNKWVHDL